MGGTMNRGNLQTIFSNYIKKFELTTNDDHDESYKWRIAYQFPTLMDTDHPDFAERMKQAWKLTENLIDSSNRYCFSALVSCAEKEPEEVRLLFKALFAEDGGDLTARQQKIDQFIMDANALILRLHSTNGMFMNDQRSAMGYLFLYNPDNHYLYKASEANSFASCVEFYDDWGSGTDFKLDTYYKMCDFLVEEIRNSPNLIDTNNSRFFDRDEQRIEGMHPDSNYHILAFDIIYGAPEFRYNFYDGIPFTKINAPARKLHEEREKKAKELLLVLQKAQAKADLLDEAKAYFAKYVTVGLPVKSRMFGDGTVTEISSTSYIVSFPAKNETKKLAIMRAFTDKNLTAEIPELTERIALYQEVVRNEALIPRALESAEKAFEPYRKYLE